MANLSDAYRDAFADLDRANAAILNAGTSNDGISNAAIIKLIVNLLYLAGQISTSVYYGREIYKELNKHDTDQLLSILTSIIGGMTIGSAWPITAPLAIHNELKKRRSSRKTNRRSKRKSKKRT